MNESFPQQGYALGVSAHYRFRGWLATEGSEGSQGTGRFRGFGARVLEMKVSEFCEVAWKQVPGIMLREPGFGTGALDRELGVGVFGVSGKEFVAVGDTT